jgi:hypothetical protein
MPDGVVASTTTMTGSVVAAKAIVMKVLALRAHAPAGEGLVWLIAARLALLSFAPFATT